MKHFVLFTLFLLFITTTTYSQRFVGSVIGGVNATQVDGDNVAGFYKFGFNGGAALTIALNQKQTWFATMELLYTQKGSYAKSRVDTIDSYLTDRIDYRYDYDPSIKYRLRLDYVEIPIVFHYEDPKTGLAIGAGVSWGRLVNINEVENGWHLNTNMQSDVYTKNDWSVIADAKIRVWKGLKLNIRYQYSFIPLRTREFIYKTGYHETRKQYNNVLTVRVIYSINERYKLNERKNKFGERIGAKWIRDVDINGEY